MIPKQTGMITLGSPRLVIPIRFGVFWPNRAKKRRNGPLGSPGLSSQSVLRFSGQKGPKKPETDWDDKPGKPRFGVFWPKCAKNPKTDWGDSLGKPRLVIPVCFGFFLAENCQKHRNGLG